MDLIAKLPKEVAELIYEHYKIGLQERLRFYDQEEAYFSKQAKLNSIEEYYGACTCPSNSIVSVHDGSACMYCQEMHYAQKYS